MGDFAETVVCTVQDNVNNNGDGLILQFSGP